MTGAVCWKLSHALYGGLRLQNGRFVNTNFDSYNLMRIHQAPEVEVHFALSQDGWWGGMGEPGGPPAPAAVANAIYFATGKRVRSIRSRWSHTEEPWPERDCPDGLFVPAVLNNRLRPTE